MPEVTSGGDQNNRTRELFDEIKSRESLFCLGANTPKKCPILLQKRRERLLRPVTPALQGGSAWNIKVLLFPSGKRSFAASVGKV
jgi:hypothetical protein